MTIVYYTQAYYLDAVIEILKSIKYENHIHLVIEINQESKNTSILDIKSLEGYKEIEDVENVLNKSKWKSLAPFMKNFSSTKFAIFKEPKAGSVNNIKTGRVISTYINNIKPNLIHFDTLSFRTIWLYPWLRIKNISISIHDSVAHSGEGSWKDKAALFVYKNKIKSYFFYSFYSRNTFLKQHKSIKKENTTVLQFEPYTYYKDLKLKKATDDSFILFFGRISPYKGIDILIEAIPRVLKYFPDQKFVIAGKGSIEDLLSNISTEVRKNIIRIDKYLDTKEISNLIYNCKFVVCPYRDASQSGVLMTTNALGKSVLASDVGAFPEYIKNEKNGKIVAPEANALSEGIIDILTNKRYIDYESYIASDVSNKSRELNRSLFSSTYQNLSK